MTRPVFSSRVKIIAFFILILLVCTFVVGARRITLPDTALDSLILPTSTHAPFSGMVQLAKPTYTFTPLPTLTPVIEPSATMEVVDLPLDTSLVVDPSEMEET